MGITATKNNQDHILNINENNHIQEWDYEDDLNTINEISPRQIISYDKLNGKPLSYFKDNKWVLNYTPNPKHYKSINFNRIDNENERELVKRLMFTIIHFTKGNQGTIKTPRAIKPFYENVLFPIQQYALNNNTTMKSFFQNKLLLNKYITTIIKNNVSRASNHLTLLTLLKRLPQSISGIFYEHDSKHFELLSKYIKTYNANLKQSECIPPRILRNAQQMRWEHVDLVYKILPQLIKFIETLMNEPCNYHSLLSNARLKAKKLNMPLPEEVIHPKQLITDKQFIMFCKTYKIENRETLRHYLAKLSYTCRHLLYGYTGMRNDEGFLLKINCYKENAQDISPTITAIEKKNGLPTIHAFVTIKEIKKVIDVQTAITRALTKYSHPNDDELPLFASSSLITHSAKYLEQDPKNTNNELPLDESKLIIDKDDMRNTLIATEPNRDWENDKVFQVGNIWHFKWHQYRRSIAVYALNSGLVNIAALGKQYRHMFQSTTAHYGNGYFIASPLAGTNSKHHIKQDIKNLRNHFESLAMYRDLMFNLERPESGFAPLNNDDLQNSTEDQIIEPETPNTIAKKIKKGEVSYTNTALGHCKSMQACDGHMMLFFTGCIECNDAEINDLKLSTTIESVNNFKNSLELHMPNSIELKDTKADLEALVTLQQKRQGEKNE